ncbi:glycerophosphodiester phosphodiesterase family protein, partial [Streptococcus pneumoniae]|nr:glycerophosphodiester phosphodiesterase family protein [Streptococcus pneumoniae]
MNPLKECYEKNGILIAAHRGTNGGNILQNTSKAYLNSIRHNADMFEVDVIRSKDGEFFAFHDGQEPLAEIIQSNRETHKLIAEALLKYETLD